MAEKILYQIIVNLNITCQLLLSALIFYLPLRCKRYFALWLLLSLVCDAGLLGVAVLIRVQGGSAVIEVTNFFDGIPIRSGGTSKTDHSRHGFGTMSMRYIAKFYHGTIRVNTDGQLYCLRIMLPIPESL